MFYAVVYGDNWEDIDYFSGYNRACEKLIRQTLHMTKFHPFLMEYMPGDHGVMERTKNMMAVTNLTEFNTLDKAQVALYPDIAFDHIKSIF